MKGKKGNKENREEKLRSQFQKSGKNSSFLISQSFFQLIFSLKKSKSLSFSSSFSYKIGFFKTFSFSFSHLLISNLSSRSSWAISSNLIMTKKIFNKSLKLHKKTKEEWQIKISPKKIKTQISHSSSSSHSSYSLNL